MNKNLVIYQYAKSQIGKKLSPRFKDKGCVEALNNIFKEAIGEYAGGSGNMFSTKSLYLSLLNDSRFEDVTLLDTPSLGCIIISSTGFGNGKVTNGHVGILSDAGKIMSNNSETLCWDEHLTVSSWTKRYRDLGGFPIRWFQLKDAIIKEEKKTNLEQQVSILQRLVALWKELLLKLKK